MTLHAILMQNLLIPFYHWRDICKSFRKLFENKIMLATNHATKNDTTKTTTSDFVAHASPTYWLFIRVEYLSGVMPMFPHDFCGLRFSFLATAIQM